MYWDNEKIRSALAGCSTHSSRCVCWERPQKCGRREFFMTVTVVLSNRFLSTVVTVGINPLIVFGFHLSKISHAIWGTKTSSLWWHKRKSKSWLWKMLPTCCLNLMRTRQCCRKSLFSEKKVHRRELARESSYAVWKTSAFPEQRMPLLPSVIYNFFLVVSPPSFVRNERRKRRRSRW